MKQCSPIFSVLLLLTFTSAVAQPPDWADSRIRQTRFNESEYLVGFASEPNTQKENPAAILARLESYAKGQVIEYIQVTVRSETELLVTETNSKHQQTFRSMNSSSSNLSLSGLRTETAFDQKGNTGYALVYTKRSELLTYYKGILNNNLLEAERKVKTANEIAGTNSEQAFRLSLESLGHIADIEQAQSVIIALMRKGVTDNDTHISRLVKLKTDIDSFMRNAQRGSGNTLNDACFFIARGLKLRTGKLDAPVTISNFTYQDTRIGSELSNRINQSLSSRLVNTADYAVAPSGQNANAYVLTGTYWKEPTEIKLVALLKKNDGSIVATAEAYMPLAWVESSMISYLPENFEEAFSRMRVFNRDEVVRGDLNLEIWTNKGDENLVYAEGERLKFFVRANKECYIRMIYHLADNQSVLIMDNYYVAAHLTNKVIELPDEFECAEPFGVETLQVNAQSKPFDPLRTKSMYGYKFIDESFGDIVLGTRGFKRVEEKPVDKAEKRLVFTTMPR